MIRIVFIFALVAAAASAAPAVRPDIILLTDDQGWGETGYNGHPHLKTPVLNERAWQRSVERGLSGADY